MSSLQQQADAAYQRKVVQKLEQAVAFMSLAFYAGVKYSTPVDTGRARSNWHLDNNTMEVKLVEPNQGQTDEQAAAVSATYKINQIIYISNNLPYIRRLNEGHSKQAPAGFVDDALQSARQATERKFAAK